MLKSVLAITIIAAGSQLPGAAFAEEPETVVSGTRAAEDVRVERVGFGDINLSAPDGVKTLTNRVRNAAKRVCNEERFDHEAFMKEVGCQYKTMSLAKPQIARAVESQSGRDVASLAQIKVSRSN